VHGENHAACVSSTPLLDELTDLLESETDAATTQAEKSHFEHSL